MFKKEKERMGWSLWSAVARSAMQTTEDDVEFLDGLIHPIGYEEDRYVSAKTCTNLQNTYFTKIKAIHKH